MSLLSVRNLVKHYKPSGLFERSAPPVRAVDGVSFDVEPGQTLGLAGESGCGKSTVARTVLGLEKPTAGEALFEGKDIFSMTRRELTAVRRDIQIIFQDPQASLNPRMTVHQIVSEGWEIHPDIVEPQERRSRAAELLRSVGLSPDHLDRYPHEFSGGQRQRIGVARALAVEPKLIICDEPVSALDVSIQAQIINLLQRIQADLGVAYIFIAHDLAVVRHISDRIAVMYLGKIVETGTEREIFEGPTHPYTQSLLSAIPPPDPEARSSWHPVVTTADLPDPTDVPSGCAFRTRCWKATEICAEQVPELLSRASKTHSHRDRCHHSEPWLDLAGSPPDYERGSREPASESEARVEVVPEPVSEQVEAQHRDGDGDSG